MLGYFQDNNGDKSMARLLAFIMQVSGTATIVVGLVLIVVAFFTARDVGTLVGLVGTGAAMDVAGPAMKNWSKRAEARVAEAEGRVDYALVDQTIERQDQSGISGP